MYLPLFLGVSVFVFVWHALDYVHTSFAVILTMKRELVALLKLSFGFLVTVNVLWLVLMMHGLVCSV